MAILHFQEAMIHHHEWLAKVIVCLTSDSCDLTSHEIISDHNCLMGKWLHGSGQYFSHLPEFQTVLTQHRILHETAGRAWKAKKDENMEQVQALLEDLSRLKKDMFVSWNELNSAIRSFE